ncbi:phosphatase [Bacillaceae bacterium SAS-127]|nr:phosphatase [Bacillaceae bacterium SAS-127]
MLIDLHCHSKISDNSMPLADLIGHAKQRGVTHLAITDHDTTKGLIKAEQLGKEIGVEIIPGIEISAFDFKRNRRAHILGYFVSPNHSAIKYLCDPLIQARHEASYQMTQKIIDAGYDITWEEVENYAVGGTGVYKQHIMHALMAKGYTDTIYGELYNQLFSRGGDGQPVGIAFVPLQYVDVVEAIFAIRAAGGVPVLAHPKQFNSFEAIGEWVSVGLEGIEVLHPLHGPEDEKLAMEFAEKYRLVETAGSDFHGLYGDSTQFPLGCKDTGVDRLNKLKERHVKIHSK